MKGLTLANAPARCVLEGCGVPLVQTRKGPPRKFCSEEHERLAYRARMKLKRAAKKATQ